IVIQGVGNLRLTTLVLWTVVATAAIAGLAWYDIWRIWPLDHIVTDTRWTSGTLPSFRLFFFLSIALFIAHALIAGAGTDRRFIATYPTHFDVAWKLAIQVALSFAFVGAFWLVLWLGAGLFMLIKLDFFEHLLEHRWFSIPATSLATAIALHVSDV